MEQDSLRYDSLGNRPLPQWLVRQKEGLNTYQPEMIVMKEVKYLQTSFVVTGIVIILIISLLTVYILKRGNK